MHQIARSIARLCLGLLVLGTLVGAKCDWDGVRKIVAPSPDEKKYYLGCTNLTDNDDLIRVFTDDAREDFGWKRFDHNGGWQSYYVHSRSYHVQICRNNDQRTMVADFGIDINSVYGDAHYNGNDYDALIVYGPGGYNQSRARPTGPLVNEIAVSDNTSIKVSGAAKIVVPVTTTP
ncbi:MAG: hypothetical protein HY975_00410 [Candidatus Kerfeldbacteria bacterium]|nr:hypothetical protein [Candidatus Kerfeldbacteria bacterium]